MRAVFFIVLFLTMQFCFAQKNKADTTRSLDPAGDLYKASLKLIDSVKYKEAIKLLEKSVKIKKDNAEVYNKMAFCQMELKNFSDAQKSLELSAKYAPDNTNTLKYLGRACYLGKKYDMAKKVIKTL